MRHPIFHRMPQERRGIATLEFAMCLPVLLALFVLIVWLGANLIGQSEVTVVARHKAWAERFQVSQGSGNPLVFKADSPIQRDAETTVDISPIFAGQAPPKTNHAILAGSWDHRQIDLNRPPNWSLYAKVGGRSASLSVQSLLGNLGGSANFSSQATGILGGLVPQEDGGQNLNSFNGIKDMLPIN
jgi:hypothetical protein